MMEIFVVFKYNASYIRQDIVHILLYECAYKTVYNILIHKLYTLKSIVNLLWVLMVVAYTEKFKAFKKSSKNVFTNFQNRAYYYSLKNPPDNPNLFTTYWIIFNRFLDECICLKLLVIKLKLFFVNIRSLKLPLLLNYVIIMEKLNNENKI